MTKGQQLKTSRPDYYEATLPCGLRIIYEPANTEVVYCGIVVGAGTRHEDAADSGMAHFIEHTTFKGTTSRKAYQINGFLERRGGDLSAFTTKQETVYYATALKSDFHHVADILTDIVFHSTYPQAELDREKEVICDEIDSYLDTPSDLIFDEFETLIFPNHPLGRDILGKAERLKQYTTSDAHRYANAYYHPRNCVFYAFGDLNFARMVKTLESLLPASDFPVTPQQIVTTIPKALPISTEKGWTRETDKQTHQAHVLMGCRTIGGNDKDCHALTLLNNIIGGPAPNSRFNVRLREKAGLVYSVDAYIGFYPDAGVWSVYFGCDQKDIKRCQRLIRREMDRFIEAPITENQLRTARQQLVRQLRIARDHFENHAVSMGRLYAKYGIFRNIEEVCALYDDVTPADLQRIANDIFNPERLSTLIYK